MAKSNMGYYQENIKRLLADARLLERMSALLSRTTPTDYGAHNYAAREVDWATHCAKDAADRVMYTMWLYSAPDGINRPGWLLEPA